MAQVFKSPAAQADAMIKPKTRRELPTLNFDLDKFNSIYKQAETDFPDDWTDKMDYIRTELGLDEVGEDITDLYHKNGKLYGVKSRPRGEPIDVALYQFAKQGFQPTKETIWNDPKHALYGISPSEQNEKFLTDAIAEIERNTQSPAHFKFYAGGSGGTMGDAQKQLARYKKALEYIRSFGGK